MLCENNIPNFWKYFQQFGTELLKICSTVRKQFSVFNSSETVFNNFLWRVFAEHFYRPVNLLRFVRSVASSHRLCHSNHGENAGPLMLVHVLVLEHWMRIIKASCRIGFCRSSLAATQEHLKLTRLFFCAANFLHNAYCMLVGSEHWMRVCVKWRN